MAANPRRCTGARGATKGSQSLCWEGRGSWYEGEALDRRGCGGGGRRRCDLPPTPGLASGCGRPDDIARFPSPAGGWGPLGGPPACPATRPRPTPSEPQRLHSVQRAASATSGKRYDLMVRRMKSAELVDMLKQTAVQLKAALRSKRKLLAAMGRRSGIHRIQQRGGMCSMGGSCQLPPASATPMSCGETGTALPASSACGSSGRRPTGRPREEATGRSGACTATAASCLQARGPRRSRPQ